MPRQNFALLLFPNSNLGDRSTCQFAKCLKSMVARDGVEPPTPAFSGLCCSSSNLSDFTWPPKFLRRRERHANRGWKSWVREQSQPAKVAPTRAGGVLFLARRALAQSLSQTTAGSSRSVPASAASLRAVVDLPWSDSRALVT